MSDAAIRAQALQEDVGFRQVFAGGPLTLIQVGHGVQAEAVRVGDLVEPALGVAEKGKVGREIERIEIVPGIREHRLRQAKRGEGEALHAGRHQRRRDAPYR